MKIEKKIFYSKIARRIFSLFVICAMLPVIILTMLTFRQVTQGLEEQCKKRLQHMTKSVGITFYERLLLVESTLENIAFGLNDTSPPSSYRGQVQEKHYKQWFKGVICVKPSGKTNIYKTIKGFPDISENDYCKNSNGKTVLISKEEGGGTARIFMIKTIDAHDLEGGFLAAEIKPDFLWGIGSVNTMPQQTRLCVFDQTQNILFNPFQAPQQILRKLERSELLDKTNRWFEFKESNIEYLASYWSIFIRSNFVAPDWIVVLSQEKSDALEPLYHFKKIFPLVIMLSIWVVLLLSIIHIRKSLIPLENLKAGTECIAQGDFSNRVEVTSTDEFADLTNSFNTMSNQLNRQFNTLTAMAEIDRAILSSLNKDILVDTMLSRMDDFFNCEMISIGLIDVEDGEQLTYFLQDREEGRVRLEEKVKIEPGNVEQLLSREVTVIDNTEEMPDYLVVLQQYSGAALAVIPLVIKEKLDGVLVLGFAEDKTAGREDDIAHARHLAVQMAVALANSHLVEELERLSLGAIQAFGRTVDAKSSWTAGHSERVTAYAMQIAQAIPLSEVRQEILRRAALLHDIGKIGVPIALIDKPASLSHEEYEIMKKHPSVGAKILEPISAFEEIIPIIEQHHEQYDGKGYPKGLEGEAIIPEARILTVADVFDALITERPYRQEWSREKIMNYLQEEAGKMFDPQVVAIFLHLLGQEEIAVNPLAFF